MRDVLKSCMLCPRRCGVDRTASRRGVCGEGERIRAARAAPHFWEEPCISGTRGSGTVFFSGCSLRCVYCQNAALSRGRAGINIDTRRLAEIFLELRGAGVHNINLVTPTHFAPQIIKALKIAKGAGLTLPVVYNCGGYELPHTVDMLSGSIDVYMPDFKYLDAQTALAYSSAPDYPRFAKQAIERMVRQVGPPVFDGQGIMTRGVIVRHLLLPSRLSESKRIIEYLYRTYNNDIYISIMSQYTPIDGLSFPELKRTVRLREYDALVDYAISLGAENAFIQEGRTADASFIPDFDGTGIL